MATYTIPTTKRGDTFDGVLFEITVNGTKLDLTGATIKMDMRLNSTGILAKEFTSGAGITISSPLTDGKFTLDEQVIDIDAGTYVYDIEITWVGPPVVVKTYISGTWLITQDVTHA